MNRDFVVSVYQKQGPPPHGFSVALSEDVVPNPETKEPMTVYLLLFKNSDYQVLSKNRQHFVDVARWLKDTHDAIRGYGISVVIQPIFDDYEGLSPDQLKYKLQEIINKK